MTPELSKYIKAQIPRWKGLNVVELGSRAADGQEHLHCGLAICDVAKYTGIDMRQGWGVDIVADLSFDHVTHRATEPLESADVILCLEMLEHVPEFWNIVHLMSPMNAPKCGELIISVPTFDFPYHAHPVDCYRFSADALPALMPGYDIQEITYLSYGFGNQTMVARGTR